mmetsp:Transcript_68426/g.135201  ORF Transcript_68426/g.135201 Transcript_68426/m.135201 type:complete len:227 (-) Transcript_68426:123-803(-)
MNGTRSCLLTSGSTAALAELYFLDCCLVDKNPFLRPGDLVPASLRAVSVSRCFCSRAHKALCIKVSAALFISVVSLTETVALLPSSQWVDVAFISTASLGEKLCAASSGGGMSSSSSSSLSCRSFFPLPCLGGNAVALAGGTGGDSYTVCEHVCRPLLREESVSCCLFREYLADVFSRSSAKPSGRGTQTSLLLTPCGPLSKTDLLLMSSWASDKESSLNGTSTIS